MKGNDFTVPVLVIISRTFIICDFIVSAVLIGDAIRRIRHWNTSLVELQINTKVMCFHLTTYVGYVLVMSLLLVSKIIVKYTNSQLSENPLVIVVFENSMTGLLSLSKIALFIIFNQMVAIKQKTNPSH